MHATVDHLEMVTPNVVSVWFRTATKPHYVAGQFTELILPHDAVDNRGQKRWFTLSSSPTEPLLGITSKLVGAHGSSFKKELANLRPGATLNLAEPMGDFVLPKDPSIPLVFVAGGMGITPVRSIIKWLIDTDEKRDVQLIYATSSAEELLFMPLFRTYAMPITTVLSKAPRSYNGERGRLTAARVLALSKPTPESLVYISGPEIMTEALFKDLCAAGISADRLVTDYFPGYEQV